MRCTPGECERRPRWPRPACPTATPGCARRARRRRRAARDAQERAPHAPRPPGPAWPAAIAARSLAVAGSGTNAGSPCASDSARCSAAVFAPSAAAPANSSPARTRRGRPRSRADARAFAAHVVRDGRDDPFAQHHRTGNECLRHGHAPWAPRSAPRQTTAPARAGTPGKGYAVRQVPADLVVRVQPGLEPPDQLHDQPLSEDHRGVALLGRDAPGRAGPRRRVHPAGRRTRSSSRPPARRGRAGQRGDPAIATRSDAPRPCVMSSCRMPGVPPVTSAITRAGRLAPDAFGHRPFGEGHGHGEPVPRRPRRIRRPPRTAGLRRAAGSTASSIVTRATVLALAGNHRWRDR